jgi:hypothetical protein
VVNGVVRTPRKIQFDAHDLFIHFTSESSSVVERYIMLVRSHSFQPMGSKFLADLAKGHLRALLREQKSP